MMFVAQGVLVRTEWLSMSLTRGDRAEPYLSSSLLAGVDEAARLAIFQTLTSREVPSGFALLEQGKVNDRLWFVIDGRVVIERTRPDGRLDILATLAGPAIYGTSTFFRRSALSATIRAGSDLILGSMDHRAHDRLRSENPRAAEALALSVVQTLSEHFDMLDRRLTALMSEHHEDHPRATEWAAFRARLFEEPAL